MGRPYAFDLHRKGEHDKLARMQAVANKLVKGKDMGTAFVTEGYEGYDAYCIIANTQNQLKNEGFVVYNTEKDEPEFIKDKDTVDMAADHIHKEAPWILRDK